MTVLVVDDDEAIRENYATELQRAGFGVAAVADGEQALAMLARRELSFDALVTDLFLGDGPDGVRIALEMQRRHPRARIVVMTGRHDLMDMRWREHGWVLLNKPFPARRLVATLLAE